MSFNFFKKKNEPKEDKPENVEISVKYSYEWKEDVPENERDKSEHPSRPFCKKLMELNRLYTRKEIEDISLRLGYSVWDRKGGDGCRHRWVSQIVVKKEKQ